MVIVTKPGVTEPELEQIVEIVESLGARAHVSRGQHAVLVGAVGTPHESLPSRVSVLAAVDRVIPIVKPYKLASLEARAGERTVVDVADVGVGVGAFTVIAGPCTVESREMLLDTAYAVRDAGARLLRGGAYKPRTSPYAFRGLQADGLRLLAEAKQETGLGVVTELMDVRDLEAVLEVADMVQVGARNMQNYTLLGELGRADRPVLLKRGPSATLEELLLAAEYILAGGNERVVLCERGIRTFEPSYRFTLDVAAVPVLKEMTHLPVIVDPSHAAGTRGLVEPLSLAAAAAGADGLIVEVHPRPDEALCDGPQALVADEFAGFMRRVQEMAALTLPQAEPALAA